MARARPSKTSRFAGLDTGESWLVVVAGEIRTMSAAELDGAFEAGTIGAGTPVWTAGMATWEPLGVVSSLEDGLPLESKPSRSRSDGDAHSTLPHAGTLGDPNAALWASMAPVPSITRVRRRVGAWSAFVARTCVSLKALLEPRDQRARVTRARWLPLVAGCVALVLLAAWSIGARLAAPAPPSADSSQQAPTPER
ncbi:MAG: DUF4339 domain-containing protein [Polyangiaceae bacterium]